MKRKAIVLMLLFCCAATLSILFISRSKEPPETLVITMPQSDFIRNIDTNYYKVWLEEQTGLKLVFNLVPDSYSNEYLKEKLLTGDLKTDLFFSFGQEEGDFLHPSHLKELGEKGAIIPLNQYITSSQYLRQAIEDFTEYPLLDYLKAQDGTIYYVPDLDNGVTSKTGQVLWMNVDWLKALQLPIPQTTQEFYDTLLAFRQQDPNGNGRTDEISLIGSMSHWSQQSFQFIMNSFVYNDPQNSHFYLEQDRIIFAPITPAWRQGVSYCRSLYEQGLLSPLQFSLDNARLSELVSNPRETVGAFTAASITDVIYQNCPEIMAGFVQVPPLAGPEGFSAAVEKSLLPHTGAVITAWCDKPEKAFELLDFMYSEQATLIAQYGEKGVDWEEARPTDMDVYGRKAVVRVKSGLKNLVQNKNFAGIGPQYIYAKYADREVWSGFDADPMYINARAYQTYSAYFPQKTISAGLLQGQNSSGWSEVEKAIDIYAEQYLEDFITGKRDILSDAQWQTYVEGYEALKLSEMTAALQAAYDKQES